MMVEPKTSIERAWKSMLYELYHTGEKNHKDDSPVVECIGNHIRIQNPVFSIFNKMSSKNFLTWVRKGAFDIEEYPIKGEALADYVDSINQDDKIFIHEFHPEFLDENKDYHKPFVYTYPERIQALFCSDDCGEIDCINQFEVIIDRLKNNIGSNRAIAVLYQAGLDSQAEDIPCLQLIQALVRDNKLILSVFFRSNDIYGAFPSNMLFISNIGLMIQDELNKDFPMITFDHIDYHVSSMHYYETDAYSVEQIVKKLGVGQIMNSKKEEMRR